MRVRIDIEIDEDKTPHHHPPKPQGLRTSIYCVLKGIPMPTLSYPAIPVTANVGDVYTLTGLGEGNASDTLVPGPSPAATLPYFAGDLTGTTSDDVATSIVSGTVPETFTVTILAVPAEPFVAVTLSDGATSQEYDFTVTAGPVLAPGATGLLTSIVKVSGP